MNTAITMGKTSELDERTRTAVCDLCFAATGNAEFHDLFSFLPPVGLHIFAWRGDQLVSHAVVTTRWLQPTGQPVLRTAYVDAVATLPAYQGQGLASAVMRQLAGAITDFDIAGLETGRVSFYTRLGWEPWRGPLAGRGQDGLIPTPDQEGVMILRLPRTPPLNLDDLLTIEVQRTRIW